MNEDVRITVPMTATRFSFTADYLEKKRASGLEYMLLKIIGYGEEAQADLKVSDLMSIFSMSVDLLPFIIGEIKHLEKRNMIKCETDTIKGSTSIKKIKIRPEARQFYDSGFVTDRNGTVDERMIYFPSRSIRFERNRDIEEIRSMRVISHVDPAELTDFVRSHKTYFGLSEIAEVKPAKVKKETKNSEGTVIVAGERSFRYSQPIYLYFDIPTGTFMVNAEASGVDMEKLYRDFKGEDLLKAIDKSTFVFNPRNPYEIKSWNSEYPAGLTQCVLPKDFETREGLFLYGNNLKNVADPVSAKLPEEIGCDAVVIETTAIGYKYWFTRRELGIKGFEGTRTGEVIMVQKITTAEIRKCIQAATGNLHMSDNDLNRLNKISRRTREPSLFSDRVAMHIEEGDLDRLKDTLNSINKLDTKIWKPNLERSLEDILCKRVEKGANTQYVFDFYDACLKRGYRIEGSKLIEVLLKKQKLINVADWAFVNDIGRYAVLSQSGLSKSIMKTVANNDKISTRSEFCKTVADAGEAYHELMEQTGIVHPDRYTFKPGCLTSETRADIPRYAERLFRDLESLAREYPVISSNEKYIEIMNLRPIYGSISEAIRSKRQLHNRRDFQNEDNPIRFCTLLRTRLETTVARTDEGSLEDFLDRTELLDAKDKASIREFLGTCEKVLSNGVDLKLDKNSRKKWVSSVFLLEENME